MPQAKYTVSILSIVNFFLHENGAIALRNLHTIYCFENLKLAQYIVLFMLNATAQAVSRRKFFDVYVSSTSIDG